MAEECKNEPDPTWSDPIRSDPIRSDPNLSRPDLLTVGLEKAILEYFPSSPFQLSQLYLLRSDLWLFVYKKENNCIVDTVWKRLPMLVLSHWKVTMSSRLHTKGGGGGGKEFPKLIVIYTKQSIKWACGLCARLSNTSQGLNYLATKPYPPSLETKQKCKETITTYQTNCNKKRFKTLMTYFANLSSIFSLFRSLAIFSASWYSILARWGKQGKL